MIDNGWRVYRDEDGELRIDQIVDGMVPGGVEPKAGDEDLALGYYDVDWNLVEADPAETRARAILASWAKQAEDQPRVPAGSPEGGQWTSNGGGGGAPSGVKLTKTRERAWDGRPNESATRLGKLEAGELGERIAQEYVRSLGGEFKNAQPLNTSQTNFPVDMIGDHELYEVKTGQVSNSAAAAQWRATIGQPGKAESAWLKTATPEAKRAHNAAKQQAILDRKNAILREYSQKTGQQLNGKTITTIIDPDRGVADVFMFNGFHNRIGYNSDTARQGYVGSFKYARSKAMTLSRKTAEEVDLPDTGDMRIGESPVPPEVWQEFEQWLDEYVESLRKGLDDYFDVSEGAST